MRWHKLGPNKNKFFKVNKKKFIDAFVKISDIKKNSKIEIIKNLHKAYFITRGMNTKNPKYYLFIHIYYHGQKEFINFI